LRKHSKIRLTGPALALLLCLVLLTACAVMEPPPGGPVDKTAPWLVNNTPDSAQTDLGNITAVEFVFSEKMDRQPATSWLHFFPDQRIKKTSWKGAVKAIVEFEEPLPVDTLIVMEIAGGMKDSHKVVNKAHRRFPFATRDSIYSGEIRGVLVMGDSAVSNAVIELYDVPPDTLEYFQQPLLRRTSTQRDGGFVFDWLPVPGGPWLMRAFTDPDNNQRPGDRDAQRLLPDTLSLTVDEPQASQGVTILYPYNEPGILQASAFKKPSFSGEIMAWAMTITESDTGWTPAPDKTNTTVYSVLTPEEGGAIAETPPGELRVVVFVDVDGDSTFSAIPDTLLVESYRAGSEEEQKWYLEPWLEIDQITLEPGLEASFEVPAFGDSLTQWAKPEEPALPEETSEESNE